MARTAQEVYSLFGLKSPAQVRAERDAQFAEMLKGQSGAGRAGAGVGRLLGGMFRGEDPEAQRYLDFQDITKGQNLNDPAQLRAIAAGLENVPGFGEQAVSMRMLADTIEKESRPDISTFTEYYEVDVPLLDKFGEAVLDPTTKQPIMTTEERRRTRQLKNGELQPYEAPTVAKPSSQNTVTQPKIDFIVDADGGFARVNTEDQPVGDGTDGTAPVPESTSSVIETVTPEAASRIDMQSGASRANEGTVPFVRPLVQGQPIYGDPEELRKTSNALRDQITKLEQSNNKNKAKLIKSLKKRRAEISKLIISSRRTGEPKDLQPTGKGSEVLSGFRNVK